MLYDMHCRVIAPSPPYCVVPYRSDLIYKYPLPPGGCPPPSQEGFPIQKGPPRGSLVVLRRAPVTYTLTSPIYILERYYNITNILASSGAASTMNHMLKLCHIVDFR